MAVGLEEFTDELVQVLSRGLVKEGWLWRETVGARWSRMPDTPKCCPSVSTEAGAPTVSYTSCSSALAGMSYVASISPPLNGYGHSSP